MLKKITILEALNKCMTTIKEYIGLVADKKVDKVEGKCLTTNDLTDQLVENYNTAYNHSQEPHAPSNAQKNSDITKAEIEAKLTGQIDTHFHDLSEDLSEYDRRLDVSENKIENINQEITNTIKPTLNTHETKLNNIETVNTEQNNRLEAIEIKNQEQDNRINALETNDKIQDLNIKALFTTSDIMDIEEEGNSLPLHNSKRGFAIIDEIKGNTLVNCNKEPNKELILNGNINDSADNTVTITEGVDGGLVDVALEGNTLVNVSKTKDDYITPNMEKVDQGSVISLPEEGYISIDSMEGNTLVNYCTDGSTELTLNGDIDVEGTSVTLTEGVDNGLVDVMCEGNTLVNLMTDYKTESLIEYFYPVNNKDVANVNMLKPNTVYTLIYTAKYQKTGDNGYLVIQTTNNRNEDVYTSQNLTESYIQYSYRFTTLSSANYFVLRTNTSYFYIKECMLLEGDWTDKEIPQYFEGMKSVGQDDENGHKVEILSSNSDESLSNNKEILLNEPLRGLPNGVKDRFVKIGGKWFIERKCREIIIDDSINWSAAYVRDLTSIFYTQDIVGFATSNFGRVTPILSTHFPCISEEIGENNIDVEGMYTAYDGNLCISIANTKLSSSDASGLKQWFRSNPVKAIYQLATPIYEPLEIEPTLNTYNEVTHLSNNSIIPCNMKIKNTGYNAIIKPSTIYTVAVDTNKSGTIGINLTGAEVTTTNNVATITIPETLTDDSLRMYGKGIKASGVRLLEGDKTNWIPSFFEGMKSSFEDKVQEDNSYKMEILMRNSDESISNKIQFSSIEPLRKWDRIVFKDSKLMIERNCGIRPYEDGDFNSYITDKVNTVYQLAEPTYEEITYDLQKIILESYNNGTLFIDTNIPPTKVTFNCFEEELTYLYPATSYTVQFVSNRAITADITLGGTSLLAQNIVKGLNRISITTPATLANNKLVIDGVGANISEVVVTNTNRAFKYFERMKSVGEGGNLVITSSNSDNSLSNTQTLTHAPLRSVGETKDRYVLLNGNWYIERKCGVRAYQEGDKDNYKTDLVNTVYPLEMPIYEEIEYNPLEVYSGTTHITTNSTIPTNIVVKNHGFNCLLKPSTTYTISSNLGLNTVITPSTLSEDCLRFMDTDTSDVTTMRDVLVLEGDWTSKADLIPAHFAGMESCYEQELVTDEADPNYGKYKVNAKVTNEDKTQENNITLYISEPLRGTGNVGDKVFIKNDKVVVQRNCGVRAYEDGDFSTYITDKVNTVYPLAEPTYEEVEYFDSKLYMEIFNNSTLFYNSNIPVTSKVHYSYSVPLVDKVSQTANISDEQDSMIIDLATQCAVMEIMLM